MFGRKKHSGKTASVQTVSRGFSGGRFSLSEFSDFSAGERRLYDSLRNSVPVIDAAICKIVRLTGSFKVVTGDDESQRVADDFTENVRVNGSSSGLHSFVCSYLDSLLTYGEAIGEMIPFENGGGIAALYNASLDDAVIKADGSPLSLKVCRVDSNGVTPVKRQELVLPALLNQIPGTVRGKSVLSGLPFVSSALTRIFESLKTNWERLGDVRFAVTYNPDPGAGELSEESVSKIADEWKKAMRGDSVCDFVAVGDVSVKAIGTDTQMPDCEIPARVLLEQIVAKLGIPPFLLGLSWSSTERMSEQQADILTSELEYYRRAVEPAIKKAVSMHLRLSCCDSRFRIVWDDINLQDAVELSQARLNNANAARLERETGLEVIDE